ncbi:G2/M phase-specific E3 ubiquitin-protein ligase-like [Erpetoichthys calabaricus]|nr:G2/M phase-specific E3 ubiquitin-protein ligase-like [Erpetoichthys calabaricus]
MSPNQGAIFTPLAQNFNETSGEIYSDYVNLLENEEYLSEDSDIQEAISRSLMEETFKIQQDTSLSVEQILMPLTTAINEHEVTRFNIMRRNVWDGTVRAMSRPNFTPKKRIDVKFTDDIGISEGAVDLGGPKREYFRLCLKYLKDYSGMFEGASGSKLLSCNSAALKENCYFFAGQLIAMSVVHGGQSPCFFSPILYKSLAKGPENTEAEVEDILDIDIRNQLIEIKTATSDTQLQVAISRASCILSLSGCFKKITLENKGAVTKDVAHWYVLQRTRTPFERFQEGLQSLGVLSALQQFPQQLQSLFIKLEKKLTAIEVEQLFKFRMSEEGSNRYEAELLVVGFWRDYLQDAEFCVDAVTLEEILIFATGSDSVPPLGFFPEPSLEFLHCKSKFPLANTCDCILRIPLTNNYTNFKNNMNFGIRNSPGFGKA